MPLNLNAISWNVESISESKLTKSTGSIPRCLTELVYAHNIDLIMIMEVSPLSASVLHQIINDELNTKQNVVNAAMPPGSTEEIWSSIASDPTGKHFSLPSIITPSIDLKRVDAQAYFKATLGKCYNKIPGPPETWHLKPAGSYTPGDEVFAIEALLNSGFLRSDKEAYLVYFRSDKQADGTPSFFNTRANIGLHSASSGLVSHDAAGNVLGYQNPMSPYNGRNPCRIQLYNATYAIPLILFHAPFGDSLGPRISANNELLQCAAYSAPGILQNLAACPISVICGDFNIDNKNDYAGYGPGNLPIPVTATSSQRNYGYFVANGYTVYIQESSSLVSIAGANPAWTNPLQFRSSAYDNICVKSSTPVTASSHGIIDLIAWLHAGNLPGHAFANLYDAFKFCREKLSDHLPAMIKMTLP